MSRINDGGIAAIGQDQFLQLLVAQLQNQDPLDPVSDREFIAQLATFSQLQQTTNVNTNLGALNASFAQMLALQQLTQGADLVGKTVDFARADGTTGSGRVESLNVENGNYLLKIGNDTIDLGQVRTVRA